MENETVKTKKALDRDAWVRAALELLAGGGVAALRVETLARHLKVTKGSFYWHFKDRGDLLRAVLQGWKDGRIRDILKQTRAEPGRELERIHHMIDVYSASRNRKGMMIELAVRDWARHDAEAAAVVSEVDEFRLAHAATLFERSGMAPAEATTRSMLLYAYVFGMSLMSCGNEAENIAAVKRDIAELIARSASDYTPSA